MSEMMDRIQAIIDRRATNGSEWSSDLARDILEEMMEPTQAMADNGWLASRCLKPFCKREVSEAVWTNMILTALNDQQSPARTNSDLKTVLKTASEPEEKP